MHAFSLKDLAAGLGTYHKGLHGVMIITAWRFSGFMYKFTHVFP